MYRRQSFDVHGNVVIICKISFRPLGSTNVERASYEDMTLI